MNILLKHRVKLIRAMIKSKQAFNCHPLINNEIDNIIKQIREDKQNHFLSVSQDELSQVSYSKNEENKLNNKRRIKTTLGRYIAKNFNFDGELLNPVFLYEYVSTVWGEYYCDDIKVEIIDGDSIEEEYEKCDDHSHSCMTGENSDLARIYTVNSDKVCLVKYGPVRALLWTTDQGVKVLDRCYPSGHNLIYQLLKWANKKGYVIRDSKDKCVIGPTVELSDKKIYTVTLSYDERIFPYLDTFCFGKFLSDHKIVLSNDCKGYDVLFRTSNGETIRNYYLWCYRCGCKLDFNSNVTEINVDWDSGRTRFICERCTADVDRLTFGA